MPLIRFWKQYLDLGFEDFIDKFLPSSSSPSLYSRSSLRMGLSWKPTVCRNVWEELHAPRRHFARHVYQVSELLIKGCGLACISSLQVRVHSDG